MYRVGAGSNQGFDIFLRKMLTVPNESPSSVPMLFGNRRELEHVNLRFVHSFLGSGSRGALAVYLSRSNDFRHRGVSLNTSKSAVQQVENMKGMLCKLIRNMKSLQRLELSFYSRFRFNEAMRQHYSAILEAYMGDLVTCQPPDLHRFREICGEVGSMPAFIWVRIDNNEWKCYKDVFRDSYIPRVWY